MLIERAPAPLRSHRLPRWLWISGACVFAAFILGIVILAAHWPFTREAITRALEKATSRPVEIGGFHRSYFPPGCMADDVRILHNAHRDAPPLVTIKRLMVQGSFLGMFTSPKRLAEVKVAGMRVVIPPKGSQSGSSRIVLNSGSDSLAIGKIVADGALLEFLPAKPDDQPYRLRIDALKLTGVGSGKPMMYDAILTNSEPPGVIHSRGAFGPWNPDDPGVTPVSGDFTYRDVNLGAFHSISGILQAKGKFRGPLGSIEAEGTTEIPDFHVENSGSTIPVTTAFRAVVNGTNGDTRLDPVEAHFLRTTVIARGPIAGGHGEKGKTATLQLSVPKGRIDDILRLFVEEKSAPLSGAVRLDGTFLWPPGPAKFLEKIRMDLGFGVRGGSFRSETTQGAIDRISKSAQGESKDEAEDDPRTVLSDLRGSVAFRDGVATFRGVSFRVPGASATLRGTYGLTDHRVDLHGVLTTTGKLSDTTSGFKAFILKAITPFFKKKHNVKVVPFKITGTFKNASVSLD